jgi:CheY-like chemotaxis protein
VLRKLGLRADVVTSGEEAIAALTRLRYDVVLMDVQMPGIDGLEATERIRSGAAGGTTIAVPVIAMTAHAMQGDREACFAAGMNDYVSKPLSPRSLADALRRWLPDAPGAAIRTRAADAAAPDAPTLQTPTPQNREEVAG